MKIDNQMIEEAKQCWLIALEQMKWADKDRLESAILYATACEKRYMALLQAAREQGYTAWDMTKTAPRVANK